MIINFEWLSNWLQRYETFEDGYKLWFAWRPVFIGSKLVWLKRILRYDENFHLIKIRNYKLPSGENKDAAS